MNVSNLLIKLEEGLFISSPKQILHVNHFSTQNGIYQDGKLNTLDPWGERKDM